MEQAGCTQALKLSAEQAVLSEQALEQVQAVKLAEQEQKQAGLQAQSLKCPHQTAQSIPENSAVDADAAAALTKLLANPSMAELIKNLAKNL